MTDPILSKSNQLFSSAVVTADSTSFAFRSDNTKNAFNYLAAWIKGRLGSATIVLQTLKPGVIIKQDTEADWLTTQDTVPLSDEFQIEFLNAWIRFKVSGVGAVIPVVSATQNSGVEVNFEITTHGLKVGDKIVTTGFTPAAYNGTFVVKAVVGVDNITVDLLSDPGGDATVVGDSASTVIEAFLRKDTN